MKAEERKTFFEWMKELKNNKSKSVIKEKNLFSRIFRLDLN